ncbi:hypothetical protein TNCV_1491941 [Trichonephila clavipes]|nr:hypothetical protein TNCV_1491941 [Trichonephila clavipes]
MGLSQADAARRLNVSRSVVQRFNTNPDSVSRRPVPGRPRATTPEKTVFSSFKEEPLCRSSLQTTFKHQEEEFTSVRNRLHNAGLYAKTSCVRSLTDDSEGNRLCWAREHVSRSKMGFCAVHRRVQIYNGVIQGVYMSSALSIKTLLKDTV